MTRLLIITDVLISFLPSWLKVWIYRTIYRFEIGKRVKIGWGSALVRVGSCRIESDVRIGCFNLFYRVQRLDISTHAQIGHANFFRGGEHIAIGSYATILRGNVFNAIIELHAANPTVSELTLGDGAVVTTSHWIDFTDQVTIGSQTILGGRGSSLWTHNRQRTRPITIANNCYLGSEVRIAPGVVVSASSIVALGSVLMGEFHEEKVLIMGNPASVKRSLTERDLVLVTHPTREDIQTTSVRDVGEFEPTFKD